MNQWYIFFMSFGCLLILLSYQATSPLLVILSGVLIAGYGAYKVFKKK